MIPRNTISVEHESISIESETLRVLASRTGTGAGDRSIRIWLVDDNRNFRALLADLLSTESRFECERDFPSAEAVLEALTRGTPPDVILLDIDMGGMSGLDAIRPIKSLAGSTRVLMLTAFFDGYRQARALRDGASAFLLKSYSVEKISSHILQAQEQPFTQERVPASMQVETQEPEFAGSLERTFSIRPGHREPGFTKERFGTDGASQQYPEKASRNMPWQGLSSGLVRGVGYLRERLGLKRTRAG
jgi:DNA-binding NarL/FixJ family response regulator